MKLSKKQEKELKLVYEAYWDYYLKGDAEAMQHLLDESYTQIGSAESEVFATKKKAVQFLVDTIDQVAGKLEMRNRSTKLEQQDHLILIHELCDLYALVDKKWVFYSKFRASTLLHEKKDGWKITHQHSSFPDTKTEVGQNVAIEKIAEENLQLRGAVKRRTVELEQKNRELEIEAALEKVRTRAMAMHKSEELAEAAELLYLQLKDLGMDPFTCGYVFIEEEKDEAKVWMVEPNGKFFWGFWSVPLSEEKVLKERHESWKRKEKIHRSLLKGQKNIDHHLYILEHAASTPDEAKDVISTLPVDLMATSLHFSHGYLLFISEPILTEEEENVLLRFTQVFELTYTRFLDLQKAETQAREAQIEAAMERIRSRAIAMRTSDELLEVAIEIRRQTDLLGQQDLEVSAVHLYEKDATFFESIGAVRTAGNDGEIITIQTKIPVNAIREIKQMIKNYWSGLSDYTIELNQKRREEWQKVLKQYAPEISNQRLQFSENEIEADKKEYWHFADFSGGSILSVTYSPPSPETKELFRRSADVFDLAYRRYMDLQKAEAQAREAQIEAALEKVRSRTMAMHKSTELATTATTLYDELSKLGVSDFVICGFVEVFEDAGIQHVWTTMPDGSISEGYKIPLKGDRILNDRFQAWKNQDTVFHQTIGGKELKNHMEFVNTTIDSIEVQEMGTENFPDPTIFYCWNFNRGYLHIITDKLFTGQEEQLLARFTKVFEQTYTRFLDLQKAEAQAREAQIEGALERVRSRTMAMHDSNELREVVGEFFRQVQQLGFEIEMFVIFIFKPDGGLEWWGTEFGEEGLPQSYDIPPLEEFKSHPRGKNLLDLRKGRKPYEVFELVGKECASWTKILLEETGLKQLPARIKRRMKSVDKIVLSDAVCKYGIIEVAGPVVLSEENADILQRFAKVFEQTYTRFLDVQKAEAQAREAQIETALERVRARTMAMHKSEELAETALVLYEQFTILGNIPDRMSICIFKEESKEIELWPTDQFGSQLNQKFAGSWKKSPVMTKLYKAWKAGNDSFVADLSGQNLKIWLNFIREEMKLYVDDSHMKGRRVQQAAFFSHGMLLFTTNEPVAEEIMQLLIRFAGVFSQTYTRFLDLQKAEAQAREAQIEAALERVRSKTMAMHNSRDVGATVVTLFDEVMKLGLDKSLRCGIGILEETEHMKTWSANYLPSGKVDLKMGNLNMTIHPMLVGLKKAWKSKKAGYAYEFIGKDVTLYYTALNNEPDYPFNADLGNLPALVIHNSFFFSSGILFAFTENRISEEAAHVLNRFANVFGQTYRRYLDLQKAEAQAREAEIELALERIRARTMAMQRSEELSEVATLLLDQIKLLGGELYTAVIAICREDEPLVEKWTGSPILGEMLDPIFIPYDADHGEQSMYDTWKNQVDLYSYIQEGKELSDIYEHLMTIPTFRDTFQKVIDSGRPLPLWQKNHIVSYKYGYLLIVTTQEFKEERVFIRFARVFEQAYIRFIDLQKAEAQAREAQIEAVLEKVRSRSLAMHKPDEIGEVVLVIVEKLTELGVILDANGITLCTYFQDSKDVLHWIASPDFSFVGSYLLPYFDHPIFNDSWHSKESGDAYFSKAYCIEEKNSFFEYAFEHSDYKHFPDEFKQWIFQNDKHILSFAWQKNSAILIPSNTGVLPTEAEKEILIRFAKVFEQAYIRFLDLQKAEAREKEAIKQSSLDRVRAEIASMRSTDDLDRITPLVWRELTTLGVPFFRCGIFIIREEEEMVHAYLSTPSGDQLAALHIGFDEKEVGLIQPAITNWRKQEIYSEEWDQERFIQNMGTFMKQGIIGSPEKYQDGETPPEKLVLQLVPFKQGMLYAGNSEPLIPEHIELMIDLANAFSVAYSRYEDFVNLDKAKESIQTTLTELKATQNQLVQSEKMASLGELTAGIAHEIQNPLNFVNNFSEVSKELIEEMMEEMQKGDVEGVKALADDIIQNLEKIHHHGQRADGIVKGMLQHSRTSSGEKELTDINVLADEYLRLAYHGLRAKDKSFNATLETHFDETIGKVNIVPQDIGRVILNLITNAFYVVKEKKEQQPEGYVPTVTVTTRKEENKVLVVVKDNGNGIPDKVKDKIFQPFFTTKPTGEGTGLGLSMSYDIVTKGHGGNLKVKSKKNEGSVFTISIPLNHN